MKKLVVAFTLVALALSGPVLAQNPYMDNVGVYFDPEATENCFALGGLGGHHVYLVLTQLTSAGVNGFEMSLVVNGPLSMTNFAYPVGSDAINSLSPPSFLVGFPAPIMAVDGAVTILEFDIIVFSTNPVNYDSAGTANVYIKEIFFHSLPEEVPAYRDESGTLKPLHQSTGMGTDPVLTFSLGPCSGPPVATEQSSWGCVKSLYR